jgi:hypothetical protein
MRKLKDIRDGYVSHAQRKAVWASKADGGKGHPDNKKKKKNEAVTNEISVAARNKYYDSAKKDIERAKSSAVGKILRGKEADGTRHDHSIELKRIARREKGIKTAKNQAIKNIRGELYGKKKTNEDLQSDAKKRQAAADSKERDIAKIKNMIARHQRKHDHHQQKAKEADSAAQANKHSDSQATAARNLRAAKEKLSIRMNEEALHEDMNFRVEVEGLPAMFMYGSGPAQIKTQLRKIIKQPSMIQSVKRVTDAEVKRSFRLKAQGRDDDSDGEIDSRQKEE